MRSLTFDQRIDAYLDAVRERLNDVPADEREEILDDLRSHLFEVVAEGDGDLEDRLGPPERYADELRASAGLTIEPSRRAWRDRLADAAVVRAGRSVADTSAYRAVAGFLPEVRPGWWVLRGYLAVVAVDAIFGTNTYDVIPRLFGSRLSGLLAVAGAVWASVAFGRRTPTEGSARVGVWFLNASVVLLGLAALAETPQPVYHPVVEHGMGEEAYLQHADGEPIANICPYSAEGEPLTGVLLFDGRGRPVENVAPILSLDTARPGNAYPLSGRIADPATGEPVPHRCPNVIVTEAAEPLAPEDAATAPPEPTPADPVDGKSPDRSTEGAENRPPPEGDG